MFLFSLRSRLIVLILIALLPGIFLTVFVANSQRQAALRGVEAQNLSTLRSAALAQSLLVASTRTLLTTLAASLWDRFYSRGRGDVAHKVLSAMRAGFGGHHEVKGSAVKDGSK